MVRYKRYRRKRYSKSTGIIKMKFQSFMDISTNDTSMQIITISAGGPDILRRLSPQFGAYKYYRIGNISVKLVPASTLPVDPTGLSITAGDNLVDPRDQLTPGMMRITNGEDVFENISGLTDGEQHALYDNMLLDPRWYKWMLQSGVKRHATPRYWQIGQLHQDKWPGAIMNIPKNSASDGTIVGTGHTESYRTENGSVGQQYLAGSDPRGIFQVGHRGVLGWLPTDNLAVHGNTTGEAVDPLIASPPEVEVFKILLPKAYKTRYWYRLFITETVYFREPIVNFGVLDSNGLQFRPLDVFHLNSYPYPRLPSYSPSPGGFPTDSQTGGNYGND